MSQVTFDQLPGHARLWVFAADRALTAPERDRVARAVETGLSAWNAHGSPVSWGHRLVHDQFLVIGVDETHTALSGCSIDSAVGKIRELQRDLGVEFLDNSRVFYREGDAVRRVPRPEFGTMAREGRVTADTVVFNNILPTVGEFRDGLWEVSVSRSWHAAAFALDVR